MSSSSLSSSSPVAKSRTEQLNEKKRKRYSVAEKAAAVQKVFTPGNSTATVAQEMGVSAHSVRRWKAFGQQILSRARNAKHIDEAKHIVEKKTQGDFMPKLTERLMNWMTAARSLRPPLHISGTVISAEAQRFTTLLLQEDSDISEKEREFLKDFKATSNWAAHFLRRQKILIKNLHGKHEDSSVNIDKVRDKLETYSASNIFCVDQTSLFFRLLPRKTYTHQDETGQRRGYDGMTERDQLTLLLCSNAIGKAKVPPTVIGTAKQPRCFLRMEPPLPYYDHEKAWATQAIYSRWFEEVFLKFIRTQHTKDKVILLMGLNGAFGCKLEDPEGQVEIVSLPGKCSSVRHPMQCGTIASLKSNYRHQLLSDVLLTFEDHHELYEMAKDMKPGLAGLREGRQPHVLDAIDMLKYVWEEQVSPGTIARSWMKTKILPAAAAVELRIEHGSGIAKKNDHELEKNNVEELVHLLANTSVSQEDLESEEHTSEIKRNVVDVLNLREAASGMPGGIMRQIEQWIQLEDMEEVIEMTNQEFSNVMKNGLIDVEVDSNNVDDESREMSKEEEEHAGQKVRPALTKEELFAAMKSLTALQLGAEKCDMYKIADGLRSVRWEYYRACESQEWSEKKVAATKTSQAAENRSEMDI